MLKQRFNLLILFVVLSFSAFTAQAQTAHPAASPAAPRATPTPLVRPRLSTDVMPVLMPVPAPSVAPVRTLPPTLLSSAPPIPDQSLGLLVTTSDGKVVQEQFADRPYNPASGVKLLTALVALRTLGHEYRFSTAFWTNGKFDPASGTLTGDLYISGRDPSFQFEHAIEIARELNRMGIRTVTGDLIVGTGFTMSFDNSALRSGERFYDTLDATRRSAQASRAWTQSRLAIGEASTLSQIPSVAVMGAVYVDAVVPQARQLLQHNSSKLVDVLKVLLCYSNNFMAERLGDALGGAAGVERYLTTDLQLQIAPYEVSLASTSGLGVNRVTPRAMMKVYRALVNELARRNLTVADIMPVAGIDPGTMERRFTDFASRGSVIAKTGTLGRTDGGVSALVGQFRTRENKTYNFVIFNQRGNVARFRREQDRLISEMQMRFGGAQAFFYQPRTLTMRVASTEVEIK